MIHARCGVLASGEQRPRVVTPAGPGNRLKEIIGSVGLEKTGGCRCDEMLVKMNAWGIDGCREHRAEIIAHLKAAYKETSWADFATASAKAIASGLAFSINPLDPFGSLVDEAIRRAEST
jgi:hypothetical protein